jgi:hypothetical protein
MSPIERARCYPWQTLALAFALGSLTLALLIVLDAVAVEHVLLWLSGVAEGILLGLVLLGGVEYAVVRPSVWITRAVQRRVSSGR